MTPPGLRELIALASRLGGTDLCAAGHLWQSAGGRACDCSDEHCVSQPVYECERCGDIDYGEPGGPGFAACTFLCGNRGPEHYEWRLQ